MLTKLLLFGIFVYLLFWWLVQLGELPEDEVTHNGLRFYRITKDNPYIPGKPVIFIEHETDIYPYQVN